MKRKEVEKLFEGVGIEDAAFEAFALFRAFGCSDVQILTDNPDLTDEKFLKAVQRRATRVPLAYVLGQADFYRECYFVDENCLVPRMDTEVLVDYAVKHMEKGARFADLCTGSGCIAVSVLLHTENTTAYAADISDGALRVAKKNAERYGVSNRLTLVREDVLQTQPKEKFFAVLSNPPYVKDDVYETLSPEVKNEPRAAFVGGADGMDFYRAIVGRYHDALLPQGFFAFEIGFDQSDAIRKVASDFGFSCEIINDLGGRVRVAVLKLAQ